MILLPKFVIEITETLQYQDLVEAKNRADAIQIVKEKYRREEIVLDSQHHISTNFSVIEKDKRKDENER